MFLDRMTGAAALGAAMFVVAGASASPAKAAYVVTLAQEGQNVVATGSGTLDLTDLTFVGAEFFEPDIVPSGPEILTGAAGDIDVYEFVTPLMIFGGGGLTNASAGSGDLVGAAGDQLAVPAGYVSGGARSGSAIWKSATFASLGVKPGVYVWTWGSGADADSFTLRARAIPEPSTWACSASASSASPASDFAPEPRQPLPVDHCNRPEPGAVRSRERPVFAIHEGASASLAPRPASEAVNRPPRNPIPADAGP